MANIRNLLEVDDRTVYSGIIPQVDEDFFIGKKTSPEVKTVTPKPGFCTKTKDGKGGKVFVNICHSDELPPPKDIGEEELMSILESESPSDYKVPMSLGEARSGNDKSGKQCTLFDVVVNTEFFSKMMSSELFKTFVMTACLEGLEDKHSIELDKNEWVVLHNRKYFGEMQSVTVREKSRPFITEISRTTRDDTAMEDQRTSSNEQNSFRCKGEMPAFSLRKVISSDGPSYCVAEIRLPKVKRSNVLRLSVGEDRLKLFTTTGVYQLDIYLPLDVDEESAKAEFHLQTRVLMVKMEVARRQAGRR